MPFQSNGDSQFGVSVAYNFTYGGTSVNWGTTRLTDMGDVSLRAQPLDGDFSVSSLQASFSDTDGAIWGSLGNGTTCLGSSWSATVYVGGTVAEQTFGPNEVRLARLNTTGAGSYVIHTGRISEVKRSNRTVTIVSKSNMARVSDLEWRFPVSYDQGCDGTNPPWQSIVGTNLFFGTNIVNGYFQNYGSAFFNKEDNNSKFEVYVYAGTGKSSPILSFYPTPVGRGTLGVATTFVFPGTAFYDDYTRVYFKGSYLGTYHGTVDTDSTANDFGFRTIGDANSAKVGTTYPIGKTRLQFPGGTPSFPTGSAFYYQQAHFRLEDSPANLWQEMLTGCCVTPLFGTDSIDPVTFATARRNTAYQAFSQIIPPEGGKVVDFIKNALEPLSALWSVSSENKFRLSTYGPRTFSEVIGTLGESEIINSSSEISDDEIVNNLTLEYGYAPETGSYGKKIQIRGSQWGSSNDFPKTIKSRWLVNDNDAKITSQRLINRFQTPTAKVSITLPLTRLTADIGSLFAINDTDLGYTSRVFEVIGWSKDFSGDRTEQLEMWDGDALYRNKGYAKWEGDSSLTKTVSGTSLSGWGTNGTVHNINTSFYGTVFLWF